MKKRILGFILALCMALPMIGTVAFAKSDYDEARAVVLGSKKLITVTNDSYEDSIKADIEALFPEGNPCTVIVEIVSRFNATTEKKGNISTRIYTHDPIHNYTNSGDSVDFTIPVARQEADEVYGIEEDLEAVEQALADYVASVTITADNLVFTQQENLLSAAEKAVKNGSKVVWLKDPWFAVGMPKDGKNGYMQGTMKLTLGAETRIIKFDAVIYADGSAAINNGDEDDEPEAAEPTDEPAVEPTDEPTVEPVDEPTIDPAAEPAIDPAAMPVIVPSIPASGIAHPSTQVVEIDGNNVTFEMYALLDGQGNPTNYIKVRDLALALNGTKAQFEVDWNGAVNLLSGTPYTANGSENNTPFSDEREYTLPENPTNVNGAASDLTAIFLTDDNGGGYTYYQLRDLGKKLGFNVGWSSERGIFVETDKSYQE